MRKVIDLQGGIGLTIRKAEADDAGEVLRYAETVSGESDNLTFGPGEFGIGLQEERKFIEKANSSSNSIYLVALSSGRIVGSAILIGGSRPRLAHAGELSISVLKDFWGKGLGTELIRCIIEWARASRVIRKVNLMVRADNLAAISLYRKMGFEVNGMITRDFLIEGKFYDSLMMGLFVD